ncbi:MAG: alpha/beta fold hydrolase [Silicimonas sp.]|nr:alpha/beta fold hydrolase [Silicimonas sp.]
MCDKRLFQPQLDALSRDYACAVHITANRSLAAMAQAVLFVAPPRFALAGLSMGGILALEIMAQAPERVQRLALLDTTARADAPANHAIRTRQIEDVLAGKLDDVMRHELKPAYLVDSPEKPAILDLCLDMARSLGPKVFQDQSIALRDRAAYTHILGQIKVPTLVLCGAEDRLCPPKLHDDLHAGIKGSTLVKIDHAGHLPTLEQPRATTAALEKWLKE